MDCGCISAITRRCASHPDVVGPAHPSTGMMQWFDRLVGAVEALCRVNAEHRKGFRLRDCEKNPAGMLLHVASELCEINEASCQAHAEQELGDALAILVHVALALGLDLGVACRRWIEKIPKDFPRLPASGLKDRFGRWVVPPGGAM